MGNYHCYFESKIIQLNFNLHSKLSVSVWYIDLFFFFSISELKSCLLCIHVSSDVILSILSPQTVMDDTRVFMYVVQFTSQSLAPGKDEIQDIHVLLIFNWNF